MCKLYIPLNIKIAFYLTLTINDAIYIKSKHEYSCSESGISGSIKVNGKARSVNTFRKSSAYIHQDDALRPWLVTHESMMIAAHLKLGFTVSHEHKTKLVS